jgi:hypothetical protein
MLTLKKLEASVIRGDQDGVQTIADMQGHIPDINIIVPQPAYRVGR